MTKASGVGERRKGRPSFSVSREMSVAFPRQTLSEDADPLDQPEISSREGSGGDQEGIEPDADDDDDDEDGDDDDDDGDDDDDDGGDDDDDDDDAAADDDDDDDN